MGRFFDFAKRRIVGYILFWVLALLFLGLFYKGDQPAQAGVLLILGLAFLGSLLYTRRMKRRQRARREAERIAKQMQEAYQMQVAAYGGLSAATKRRLGEIAIAISNGDRTSAFSGVQIKPGTQLIRQWQNTTHTVMVLDEGFALDGRTYKSLSAIAKAITGTNWNGYSFFGIKRAARGNKAAAGLKRDSRRVRQPGSKGDARVPSRNWNERDSRA